MPDRRRCRLACCFSQAAPTGRRHCLTGKRTVQDRSVPTAALKKEGFFCRQTSLVYARKEASLHCKEALFADTALWRDVFQHVTPLPTGEGLWVGLCFLPRGKVKVCGRGFACFRLFPQPVDNPVDNSHNNSQVFNTTQKQGVGKLISTALLMGCEEVFHVLRTKIIGNLLTLHLFPRKCE